MSRQGYLRAFSPGPRLMRWMMNSWSPFRGAGIKVIEIAKDYRRVRVELRMKLLNRNYMGTHFGGSLFSMTDPFYVIMLSQILGRDYIIWDKAASIRFRAPGTGTVGAEFEVTQAMIDEIKNHTETGEKYEPTYPVEVKDATGKLIAVVEKTLHVRRADLAANPVPIAAAKSAE